MPNPVNLYDNVYSDFAGDVEAAVRQAAFGQDIGQSSWITAAAWLGYADQLRVEATSHVLEVGRGSGGPAIYLAGQGGWPGTGRCAARILFSSRVKTRARWASMLRAAGAAFR